ncbi:hypothetical protein OIV83_004034 [Microbotryomycetes sp. JL201]|nr:hypothetical protein OIV83_004034 [Microbotryomycetes sp. JL201]
MVVRDELLVIVDVTPTVVRAGVGVHDLIRAPHIEVSTRIGRKLDRSTPPKVSDYVVGHFIASARQNGEEMDTVEAIQVGPSGMTISDWTAFAALMQVYGALLVGARYVFHVGLSLPRPPLAHPCLISVPPHLPVRLMDELHSFFFERMLVPQLLIEGRPFFAAAASGVTSCVVLDIGARGEGTEVSVVTDNQIVENATLRTSAFDEGVLDDYCALRILEADPTLPSKLAGDSQLADGSLAWALRTIVHSLKEKDAIHFSSPSFSGPATAAPADGAVNDDGELDVAKVLVEGKLDKIVNRKKGGKDDQVAATMDSDTVEVSNPLNLSAEPIRIGPARHRHVEPLFEPRVLSALAPSASPTAQLLGLTEYEAQEPLHTGVQEMIGVVLGQVSKLEDRASALEALVVTSTGKVANNKGKSSLGSTLVPLMAPYSLESDQTGETQRVMRHARTPEYFSEFKTRPGELACFLGGSIMAKILISDLQSRLFMSKVDYTSRGPAFYRMLDAVA